MIGGLYGAPDGQNTWFYGLEAPMPTAAISLTLNQGYYTEEYQRAR